MDTQRIPRKRSNDDCSTGDAEPADPYDPDQDELYGDDDNDDNVMRAHNEFMRGMHRRCPHGGRSFKAKLAEPGRARCAICTEPRDKHVTRHGKTIMCPKLIGKRFRKAFDYVHPDDEECVHCGEKRARHPSAATELKRRTELADRILAWQSATTTD